MIIDSLVLNDFRVYSGYQEIKLSPKVRLILMTIFLIGCIKIFSIQIYGIDLLFLNKILSLKPASLK